MDYDPEWTERFRELRDQLWPLVSDIALAIEHVGSTSVPGLAAKPIIDLTIVVSDRTRTSSVIDRIADAGYVHKGDQGVPGREAFDRPADTFPHHLYLCTRDNLGLRNHLAVRDQLMQDPEAVKVYSDLKRGLAKQYPHDIDSYVDGKTDFLAGLLERAGLSKQEIDEIRGVNEQ